MMGEMLPCKYCRESYQKYFSVLPIEDYYDTREGLTFWLYILHNLVNYKVQKEGCSFKDAVIKYENMRAGCKKIKTEIGEFGSCSVPNKSPSTPEIDAFVLRAYEKYQPKANNHIMSALKTCYEKNTRY